MTLTVGSGPFGHEPAGRFNFELPQGFEYLEPFPRRIRALKGGETVVDTIDAKMLHKQGSLPVWLFRRADVRTDLLDAQDTWAHEDDLIGIAWNAVDQWLEEDEEVIVHPRDPYHRVEPRASSRLVTISLDGRTLAQSTSTIALFETSLPVRWYLPREDVQVDLRPNEHLRTGCAYKGFATYFDIPLGDRTEPFLAWTYEDPVPDMPRIAGRICFFNERVDIDVDGVRQERPRTPWSGTGWTGA